MTNFGNMISLGELDYLFKKQQFLLTEEAVFKTYVGINRIMNGTSKDINAFGVFGPSGSGKTEYATVLTKVLNEIFMYICEYHLVSTICNYDIDNSVIETKEEINKNIVDKKVLIETIKRANNNEKMILLIDGYDEIDQLTDKFLANFIKSGIIVDNGEMVKLEDKNNLILIITGNNYINLFESLETKLNKVRLNYLSEIQVLEYLNITLPNCNPLIRTLVMYLYGKIKFINNNEKDSAIMRLPSIHEILSLIKNMQFLIENNTNIETIKSIIFETMIKSSLTYEQICDEYNIIKNYFKLFNGDFFNEQEMIKKIIETLKDGSKFDEILYNQIKDLDGCKQIIEQEEEKTKKSLVKSFKELVITITDYYNKIPPKDGDHWYLSNEFPTLVNNNEWIKIAEIKGASVNNYLKKNHPFVLEGGDFHNEAIIANKEVFIHNRIHLCYDKILTNEISNLSIYASEVVIGYNGLKEILDLLKNINFSECKLNLAFLTNLCINQDISNSETFSVDDEYPNVIYVNGDFENKGAISEKIKQIDDLVGELYILENSNEEDYRFIVPTQFFDDSQYNCRCIESDIWKEKVKSELKLGKLKLKVSQYKKLIEEIELSPKFYNYPRPYNGVKHSCEDVKLCSYINYFIKDIYNDYVTKTYSQNGNVYDSKKLFMIDRTVKFFKKTFIQEGIYIVNQGTSKEFLLINPYKACLDKRYSNIPQSLYQKNLMGINKEVLSELVKKR